MNLLMPSIDCCTVSPIALPTSVFWPASVARRITAAINPAITATSSTANSPLKKVEIPGRLHLLGAQAARHLGDIDGTVRAVSAAALIDERSGQRFFRVEVTLNADAAARLVGAPLAPGMAVQGYIVTGERTPLDYLLAPVRDHMARAMREP